MATPDYHAESEFATLEDNARAALLALDAFWAEVYGPNEALLPAFEALDGMADEWHSDR